METFSFFYEYDCFIDDSEPHTIEGVPQSDQTRVRAHFAKDNEAIAAEIIISKSSDLVFITNLKKQLFSQNINLQDVPPGDLANAQEKANILQTVLIIVSSLLGVLCIVLIAVFFVKQRNMKRQLRALSTQFGSASSDLNRREAPMTNVFSVEGANPVLTTTDMPQNGFYDNLSVRSEDSDDFGGIENDETFRTNSRNDSLSPAMVEDLRKRNMNPLGVSEVENGRF